MPVARSLLGCNLSWLNLAAVLLKADSPIACRAHAAPMPFPCHAVPLRV